MNKRISLPILSIAALLFLGAGCWTTTVTTNAPAENANSAEGEAVTIAVDLVIDTGNGNLRSFSATMEDGSTALELLEKVSTEQNIPVTTKVYDFGTLVTGIDGVEATEKEFWLFSINGESATVGASDYLLEAGDRIEFRYGSG